MKNLAKENRNVNKLLATLNAAVETSRMLCFGWRSKGSQEQTTMLYLYRTIVAIASNGNAQKQIHTCSFCLLSKNRTDPKSETVCHFCMKSRCIVWPCNGQKWERERKTVKQRQSLPKTTDWESEGRNTIHTRARTHINDSKHGVPK